MNETRDIVLAIETSALLGSVAIGRAGEVLEETNFAEGLTGGRELVPAIDRLVARHAGAKSRIGLVAVTLGPGSYTGTRVGVTAAKSLASFLGAPAVGLSSLEVIAHNLAPADRPVAPVLDARRGMVYVAVFEPAAGAWRRRSPDSVIVPSRLREIVPADAIVVSDAGTRYEAELAAWECVGDPALARPSASKLLPLGWAMRKAGRSVDPLELRPIYLRLSEAEEKLEFNL